MKKGFFTIAYIIFFAALAFLFFKFFVLAILIVLVLLWLRTIQMKYEPNQTLFLQGKLPTPMPDGFYQGSVGFEVSWVGKKFDAEANTGINVFRDEKAREAERYPFATTTGFGLFDEKLSVLKIDYNVKGNHFWIRWILDEIVEVAPNHYLGKMHLRIIPGFSFSVLYFELKK